MVFTCMFCLDGNMIIGSMEDGCIEVLGQRQGSLWGVLPNQTARCVLVSEHERHGRAPVVGIGEAIRLAEWCLWPNRFLRGLQTCLVGRLPCRGIRSYWFWMGFKKVMEYQSHVESTFIHTRAICSYIWPWFLHMQSLFVHYFPLLFPMFTGEPSSFHLNPLLFQICPYETTINFPHEMDLSIMFHHVFIICFSLLSLLFTIVPHFSTWKSSSLLMFSYVFHMKSHHVPSVSHRFPPFVTWLSRGIPPF